MEDHSMAVNLGARVWAPFRELHEIVEAAVTKRQSGAVHDLEIALKRHKPDFISLLKVPAKNQAHRDIVLKSSVDGIAVRGEQRRQTFSQQFINESIILSDLFDLNELAAVELLMAGEFQLPNYPGMTRGLVAVLLFFDGQRSLVTSLRTLAQAREGRTWSVGVNQEMQVLINDFITELLQVGIVGRILDLINSMDLVSQMEKLQKERALGPPRHKKQVTDIYMEIQQTLGDVIFCLACQRPLSRQDTLRLISHMKEEKSMNADDTLDPVALSLLVALLYCFDVSVLQREDNEEVLSQLPVFNDQSYITDIHRELTSLQVWAVTGLKATAQFGWAVMLRLTSQFSVASGGSNNGADCFEDDERLIDLALDGNVFSFLSTAVVAAPNFPSEEFYLRVFHGLLTDFIHQMPLKTKELRNRGDEMSRIILAHQAEGLEPPSQRKDMQSLMLLVGDMYGKDPLGLQLSLDYWCPPDPGQVYSDMSSFRPDPKQMALFKFVRVAGDLLPAPLFLPYIHMLKGLATGQQAAHHCFSLLRVNGGQANPVSWDHIFGSMHQYYTNLRQETYSAADSTTGLSAFHSGPGRNITPQELEALCVVLELTQHIADLDETSRSSFCENQQWSVVMVLFGLLGCSISVNLKAIILRTLAAIAKTPVFAATIWQTLEASQILPTQASATDPPGGIRVELEEVESRNEEFPLTRGFLELLGSLTQFSVPMGLGAGTRSPGFDPYLDFVLNSVLLKFNSRAYKVVEEKWQVVSGCLSILLKLLSDYELSSEDLQKEMVDIPGVGILPASKQPGFTILCLLLSDSRLFKMIQLIIEDAVSCFEKFSNFPGQEALERSSLLCLQLLEKAGDRQAELQRRMREMASPLLLSSMERLLLSINPRTHKADYLINITKFVMFNAALPKHTQSAVKILCLVCKEVPTQGDIVSLITSSKHVSNELLQGFVECLDSSAPEIRDVRASALLQEDDSGSQPESQTVNSICESIMELVLLSLDLPAPNMAHWLMGFQLHKPVVKTTLQDPGVLDSPKTCLHSILSILESGVDSRDGPTCLTNKPRLANLGFHVVYALSANKDTSPPTLRYLRTTHDFLYRQLQHMPFGHDLTSHQMWLLKTVAIELRMTSLNRQRSHMHRLVRCLLGEEEQDVYSPGQGGEEGDLMAVERDSMSATQHSSIMTSGKQVRHRLLGALDTISFEQSYPLSLQYTFFDQKQIEGLVRSLEYKSEEGVVFCDVQGLRQVLLTELANQQGPMVAGHRPNIMQEIHKILETVVEHNRVRASIQEKRGAFEAWSQVVEVLLTTVPKDLLSGEKRQAVLFEFLQELLIKVSGEDVNLEASSLVSDILLTLMSNLRQCFTGQSQTKPIMATQNSLAAANSSSTNPFWGGKASSRTLFSTSLQIVLRGLIDYILISSGSVQRVRVNLYGALLHCLQIAQKPKQRDYRLQDKKGSVSVLDKLVMHQDSEFDHLIQDNMETIGSYGDSLMETVCRDACDAHHVGRMLALSVLDTVVSMDTHNTWLNFLSARGYLQHLLDSIPSEDNAPLVASLSPQTANLRALYIFQSKMSLLTRICLKPEGASILLHGGALEKLACCTVFSLRPDIHQDPSHHDVYGDEEDEDLVPSPMARYRLMLFALLRFCLAMLTSLGGENKEAATQVMLLIISHNDVFASILRGRKIHLNVPYLREITLTTAVIARANYHPDLGADLLEQDTASMEFRAQRNRLQDQMLALLPHYATPESLIKQLNRVELSPSSHESPGKDKKAEILALYLETASNLLSYCRSLIASIGASRLNQNLLFGPSLEEATLRDGALTEEVGVTLGIGRRLGLGVVLVLIQQCCRQFISGLESHRQNSQKLASLSELSVEDLKQLCGDGSMEKLSSQQRQEMARTKLVSILSHKSSQLQHFVHLVENGVYILWRHLEFFLVHCVPADQSSMTTPSLVRHQKGLRRLTDNINTSLLETGHSLSPAIAPGLSQVALGVSRADIDHLRTVAPSVLSEALVKKVLNVDERYGKQRTHYSFTEAVIRGIQRVIKLHTGN